MKKLSLKTVVILFCIAGVFFLILKSSFSPLPENQKQGGVSFSLEWNNHKIGEKFQYNDVESTSSAKENIGSDKNVFVIKSEQPSIPHKIIVDSENTTVFIKQQIGFNSSERLSSYLNEYSNTQVLFLYSQDYDDSHIIYAYPELGVAFTVQNDAGLIKQKYYFEPLSKELFLETWSDQFRLEKEPDHGYIP